MNYLHFAMMYPDRPSLALYDLEPRAQQGFASYLNDVMKFKHLVVVQNRREIRFPEGGYLRFAQLSGEMDLLKFKGVEWQNVFAEDLRDTNLAQMAIGLLFKPVYNGYRNGVQ